MAQRTQNYMRQTTMQNFKTLSIPLQILYVGLLLTVVFGVASIQGWLTYQNESDLIDIQIGQTCNAVFDAIERGWTEVKLFTETISGGFYADHLNFTQNHFRRLSESDAVQSIEAMTSLQFVKHLKDYAARQQWEADMKVEFSESVSPESFAQVNDTVFYASWGPHMTSNGAYYPNKAVSDFYMFTFDVNNVEPRLPVNQTNFFGGSTFDPIIYQTNWDPYLWGFFPDPEDERIDAINASISSGNLTCSNRINLFGDTHADNPAGMVCFIPLWTDSNGEPVPQKIHGQSTHEDVYGFVNPMFKIKLFMNNIFGSTSFGTDINNVQIYAFDSTVDANANFRTGNIGSSFMGKYPEPTADEFTQIGSETADKVVYQDGGFAKVRDKVINVGERDWSIYCCIQDKYISDKRSNLPYLIGALSIGITLVFNLFRMGLNCCLSRAQDKWSRRNSRVKSEDKSMTGVTGVGV